MAFVYRDSRKFKLSDKENNIAGPGDYNLIKDNPNNNSTIKVPFNTATGREELKDNSIPGPGSYRSENSISLKKSFNVNQTTPDGPLIDPFTNLAIERLFISSEPRFKTDSSRSNSPGPGKYNISSSERPSAKKIIKNIKLHPRFDTLSAKRILSIPNKETSFGYKEDANGNFILKHDPDSIYKFSGEENDSIGPDRYNPDNYYTKIKPNKIVSWELGKKKTRKRSEKDYLSDLASLNYSTNNTSIYLTDISKPSSSSRRNTSARKLYKNSNKIYKYSFGPSQIEKDLVEKETQNDIPGPGTYSPYLYEEQRKKKLRPKKFQNFGSSLARSLILNQSSHSNDISKISDFDLFKKKKEKIMQRPNSNYIEEEIIKKIRDSNIESKKKAESMVGPGSYDPIISHSRPSSNIENFNVMEKRFPEINSKFSTPGAGSYLRILTWVPEKPNDFLKKSQEKPIKILKQKETAPSVGQYHPELINSIEYKINKNKKNKAAPFESCNIRFKNLKEDFPNVGPGSYNLVKKYNVKTEKAPFLVGAKKEVNPKCGSDVGPGDYISDSYFDWNKKTYNILFH